MWKNAESEILMAVTTKITVFWEVMLCNVSRLLATYKRNLLPPFVSTSYKMRITIYQSTWCHIPEGSNFQNKVLLSGTRWYQQMRVWTKLKRDDRGEERRNRRLFINWTIQNGNDAARRFKMIDMMFWWPLMLWVQHNVQTEQSYCYFWWTPRNYEASGLLQRNTITPSSGQFSYSTVLYPVGRLLWIVMNFQVP
jgi:hypothetical protein